MLYTYIYIYVYLILYVHIQHIHIYIYIYNNAISAVVLACNACVTNHRYLCSPVITLEFISSPCFACMTADATAGDVKSHPAACSIPSNYGSGLVLQRGLDRWIVGGMMQRYLRISFFQRRLTL